MSKSEYTLTRFLGTTSSSLGKTAGVFFFITLMLGGALLVTGEPQANQYTVGIKESQAVFSFSVAGSKQVQLTFTPIEKNFNDPHYFQYFNSTDNVEVQIINSKDNSVVLSYTTLSNSPSVKLFDLPNGNYQVIVINHSYGTLSYIISVSQFNPALLVLLVIFLTMFGLAWGFLWVVLPFYILVLIINALTNKSGSHRSTARKTKRTVQNTPRVTHVQRPSKYEDSRDPSNWLIDFTSAEYTLSVIAVISYFMLGIDRFFLFLSWMLAIIVIVKVYRRRTTRKRIIAYMSNNSSTTISQLSANIGKRKRRVIETLQHMIIELGYPLEVDYESETVESIGDMSQYLPIHGYATVAPPYAPRPPQPPVASQPPVGPQPVQLVQTDEQPAKPVADNFCTYCGVQLPTSATYCYECGKKQ